MAEVKTTEAAEELSIKELKARNLAALQDRIRYVDSLPKPAHSDENVIEVSHLLKYFEIKEGLFSKLAGYVRAVDDVSFNIKRGTTMGLVGESGCGKTTVGKTILRLNDKTAGRILFNGIDIHDLPHEELRKLRPKIQMIFQDPYSSLSPRFPVNEIIGEAVKEHHIVPNDEFDDYIDKVMQLKDLPDNCKAYADTFYDNIEQEIASTKQQELEKYEG